jgi:hypothetical protein
MNSLHKKEFKKMVNEQKEKRHVLNEAIGQISDEVFSMGKKIFKIMKSISFIS